MSRKPIFGNNKEIVVALKSFAAGEEMSYNHKTRLVASGHIVAKDSETPREGRGRPSKVYELSGKGKGLISLSKNWK